MILKFLILVLIFTVPVIGQEVLSDSGLTAIDFTDEDEINLDDGEVITVGGDHPLRLPVEKAAQQIDYWAEELFWRAGMESWLGNDELNLTAPQNNSTVF